MSHYQQGFLSRSRVTVNGITLTDSPLKDLCMSMGVMKDQKVVTTRHLVLRIITGGCTNITYVEVAHYWYFSL